MSDAPVRPTDAYAWALAVLPVVIVGAVFLMAYATQGQATGGAALTIISLAALLSPFVLTSLDQHGITASGQHVAWGWVFLTPAAYLINRAIKLRGSSPAPMLVGVATYAVWLTLAIAGGALT
ncbi:hypothetical protein [Nocardioides sp. WS12]|uniref:hypothetical protein n=1 Tax=Nocardioides sp. WS12 TaxID=2486272 RepID=UPI0015FC7D97|nr:hypothetical protein [Nocardioides sp. WS12]